MKKNDAGRPKGCSADFDGDSPNGFPFRLPVLGNRMYVLCILAAQTLLVTILATLFVAISTNSEFYILIPQLITMSLLMNKTGLRDHYPTDHNVRCVKAFVMLPLGFWALTGFIVDTPGTESPTVLLCTVACGIHSMLALWTLTRPLPSDRKGKDK